jgi:Fe-S-cluster formation regulator IscX/YfhJ
MALLQKKSRTEHEAMQKLIQEIDNIEDDKNKVGRYVLAAFAIVFILAATLLAILTTQSPN